MLSSDWSPRPLGQQPDAPSAVPVSGWPLELLLRIWFDLVRDQFSTLLWNGLRVLFLPTFTMWIMTFIFSNFRLQFFLEWEWNIFQAVHCTLCSPSLHCFYYHHYLIFFSFFYKNSMQFLSPRSNFIPWLLPKFLGAKLNNCSFLVNYSWLGSVSTSKTSLIPVPRYGNEKFSLAQLSLFKWP